MEESENSDCGSSLDECFLTGATYGVYIYIHPGFKWVVLSIGMLGFLGVYLSPKSWKWKQMSFDFKETHNKYCF